MYIARNKEYIAEDIFEGRNSEWFNNMMGDGNDEVYDSLPIGYGISEEIPDSYSENFKDWCFRFHYINVKDFKDWFLEKRPDKDAGWVTRYERWAYENKGIKPEYLRKELHKDDVIVDMRFIEVTNQYDCSAWLYCYLEDNDIPDDATIQYCFDH